MAFPSALRTSLTLKERSSTWVRWVFFLFFVKKRYFFATPHLADSSLSSGYASYIGRISKRNSSLVQMLLDMGAVLYVRTACPQTMMVRRCSLLLFDGSLTSPPLRRSRTPSTSSTVGLVTLATAISPLAVQAVARVLYLR